MKQKGITLIEIIVVIAIVLVIGLICSEGILKCCNERQVTVTVTDKGIKRTGSGDDKKDKYLIYTDETTYEITDSLFWPRWDSSDLYGSIEVGKKYTFTIAGYRVPILSMYPNVYEATVKE